MDNLRLHIDDSLKNILPSARFAWAEYRNVHVKANDPVIWQLIEEESRRVRSELSLDTLTHDEGVAAARQAFKALSVDPARYRPSQEALLRRILSDKPLWQVNSAVDVNNLLSVRFRVALGLYDVQKIDGSVVIKVGSPIESYEALNGREVDASGKMILTDAKGPIGSPYVDSVRTSVTENTHHFLHVVYVYPSCFHQKVFDAMAEVITRFHGGETSGYIFSV